MADRNIIDGIEYETEPSYVDAETGKPVYYAKDIPVRIRRTGELTEDDIQRAEALDALSHLERLGRGADDWNHWVKVYADRWFARIQSDTAIYWNVKSWDDLDEQWREMDFHPNRPVEGSDEDNDEEDLGFEITDLTASGMVFPCRARFEGARFTGNALFDGATFAGASFDGATFAGVARFIEATFTGDAWFTEATFTGMALFGGATFTGMAGFGEATFSGYAWFGEATFTGNAGFGEATFDRKLSIQSAVFFRGANWVECTLKNGVDFSNCQFLQAMRLTSSRVMGHANFNHVWFGTTSGTPPPKQYDKWDDDLRKKYDQIQLSHDSETTPDFQGTIFEVAPNLGYTNVPDIPAQNWVWGWVKAKLFSQILSRFWQQGVPVAGERPPYAIKDGDAAAKLRVLGELAARGHHHLAEKRFFRAELLARRGWETKNGYEVAMINAFELFSKCGLSFWRPMIALFLWTLLCGAFYLWRIDWPLRDMTLEAGFELFSYSFANSLPLLGYISDSYSVSVDILFGGLEKVPGEVRVVAFLQNVTSAILIFFGLLAIRNYFKLG